MERESTREREEGMKEEMNIKKRRPAGQLFTSKALMERIHI